MRQRGPIFGTCFHHRPPANTRAWPAPICAAMRVTLCPPPTKPLLLASQRVSSVVARGDVTLRLARDPFTISFCDFFRPARAPAPLAISLSDFCRSARAPPLPTQPLLLESQRVLSQ